MVLRSEIGSRAAAERAGPGGPSGTQFGEPKEYNKRVDSDCGGLNSEEKEIVYMSNDNLLQIHLTYKKNPNHELIQNKKYLL